RTNTVVVTGPADTLKIIDTVLDQLDANPAAEQSFFFYAVKNGQAQNMAAVLNSLFGANGTNGTNRTNTNVNNNRFGAATVGGSNRTAFGGGTTFGAGGG